MTNPNPDSVLGSTVDVAEISDADFAERLFPAEQRKFSGPLGWSVTIAAASLSLITLYFAFTATIGEIATRSLHLFFTIPLTFLLYPAFKSARGNRLSLLDCTFALIGAVVFAWAFFSQDRYLNRYVGFDEVPLTDIVLGLLALFVIFEATRRTVGGVIVSLNLIFILYAVTGPYWPGLFEHRGVPLPELIETLYMDTTGIFNFVTGIMATFLFVFLLFGTLLRATGGDAVFTNLALSIAGHKRGGPAKVAVISSALMGMLSGSSISNVATTGTMTIPLMKRTGYKPHEAAAIEVVASVGGGLTPPLMGAGAFVMASLTSEPLAKILLYSIAPAILYYFSIYVFTDIKAAQRNLKGLDKSLLPSLSVTLLQGWHIIAAISTLIALLLMDYTPFFSAGACVVATFVMALTRKSTRISLRKMITTLEAGARVALSISALLASAAIIYGVVVQTGLLIKITSILLKFSDGSVLIAVVLIGLISYVVGMGMPVTASYVIIAALGAPFLQDLGLSVLAAHLIIFWFAQDSTITPPICMTAFVGARIAGSDPMQTGWECVKLGKALYLIPLVFAFGSLLDSNIYEIIFDVLCLFISFWAMQVALTGYWNRPLGPGFRLAYAAIAGCAFYATVGGYEEGAIFALIAAFSALMMVFAIPRMIRFQEPKPVQNHDTETPE
uniref:TRAP transporter permease n=1 Tax=Pararhizobium sp. IMCC3301 TaxID=3067904 RepID=UPI002741414D|nr:TRAP transporter fused permease subunit [Pararhizobium sp. IMCC3301]